MGRRALLLAAMAISSLGATPPPTLRLYIFAKLKKTPAFYD